jgi:hypothetical protein
MGVEAREHRLTLRRPLRAESWQTGQAAPSAAKNGAARSSTLGGAAAVRYPPRASVERSAAGAAVIWSVDLAKRRGGVDLSAECLEQLRRRQGCGTVTCGRTRSA